MPNSGHRGERVQLSQRQTAAGAPLVPQLQCRRAFVFFALLAVRCCCSMAGGGGGAGGLRRRKRRHPGKENI